MHHKSVLLLTVFATELLAMGSARPKKFVFNKAMPDTCYFKITDQNNNSAIYSLEIPENGVGAGLNNTCFLSTNNSTFKLEETLTAKLPNLCNQTEFSISLYSDSLIHNPDAYPTCAFMIRIDGNDHGINYESERKLKKCKVGKNCLKNRDLEISRSKINEFRVQKKEGSSEHIIFHNNLHPSKEYKNFYHNMIEQTK